VIIEIRYFNPSITLRSLAPNTKNKR
jgi:hypothetical protein